MLRIGKLRLIQFGEVTQPMNNSFEALWSLVWICLSSLIFSPLTIPCAGSCSHTTFLLSWNTPRALHTSVFVPSACNPSFPFLGLELLFAKMRFSGTHLCAWVSCKMWSHLPLIIRYLGLWISSLKDKWRCLKKKSSEKHLYSKMYNEAVTTRLC